MESTPMALKKEQRPSKQTAELFDCGVPGKYNYYKYLKPVMKDQRRQDGSTERNLGPET